MEEYVLSLLSEARLCRRSQQRDHKNHLRGGGHAIGLPIACHKTLVEGLGDIVDLSRVEEFTIEVNPDDITCNYAAQLRQLGMNRVSMGVQSFNDNELLAINRRHTAQQAIEAVKAIKEAGVLYAIIDLIYGLPGQTLDSWRLHNVEQAVHFDVQHIRPIA